MTRAGEKLYCNWEQRIRDDARPIRWSRIARSTLLLALTLGIVTAALFGFG